MNNLSQGISFFFRDILDESIFKLSKVRNEINRATDPYDRLLLSEYRQGLKKIGERDELYYRNIISHLSLHECIEMLDQSNLDVISETFIKQLIYSIDRTPSPLPELKKEFFQTTDSLERVNLLNSALNYIKISNSEIMIGWICVKSWDWAEEIRVESIGLIDKIFLISRVMIVYLEYRYMVHYPYFLCVLLYYWLANSSISLFDIFSFMDNSRIIFTREEKDLIELKGVFNHSENKEHYPGILSSVFSFSTQS